MRTQWAEVNPFLTWPGLEAAAPRGHPLPPASLPARGGGGSGAITLAVSPELSLNPRPNPSRTLSGPAAGRVSHACPCSIQASHHLQTGAILDLRVSEAQNGQSWKLWPTHGQGVLGSLCLCLSWSLK